MKQFFFTMMVALAALFPLTALAQDKTVPQAAGQVELSFAPLVKQVAPAVVNIYTKRVVTRRVSPFGNDPFFEQFFGRSFGFGGGFGGGLTRRQVESALGSGVIVDPDGLIVTNAHVIKGAEEITVVLPDGQEFEARKALVDEPSDLALLRIDPKEQTVPYVSLKPSETLEVGDLVLAVGNPFGVGQTVTSGIVSALARSSLNINDFNFFIQTDAAINPGNSGGALVAMDGGVVGINSAIFSRSGGSLGIGFAIPSEMVATVIAAEQAGQTGGQNGIIRPWLGLSAQKVTQDIADSLGLAIPNGVLIAGLHKASPARKSGLKSGDIVVAVNDKPVREPAEMKFRMATVPIGSSAAFKIMRNGKERIIKVDAIAPPDDPPRNETVLTGRNPLRGSKVANINPAVANELGLNDEEGVVVQEVDRRTQAARVVTPGDVIVAVNGDKVKTVKDLQKVLNKNYTGWQFILSRDGRQRKVVVR